MIIGVAWGSSTSEIVVFVVVGCSLRSNVRLLLRCLELSLVASYYLLPFVGRIKRALLAILIDNRFHHLHRHHRIFISISNHKKVGVCRRHEERE